MSLTFPGSNFAMHVLLEEVLHVLSRSSRDGLITDLHGSCVHSKQMPVHRFPRRTREAPIRGTYGDRPANDEA